MFVIGCLVAIVLLVGVDQLTKWWAITQLAGTNGIPLWKGVFELTYVENRGAAFGMLQPSLSPSAVGGGRCVDHCRWHR